ncbi:GDSL esterase/lipase At1g33811-like [Panicum virgatum]|uniref:GDSL esterase/lipase n=1 Tax=Panicum virgatum TaxID=38727 RepID=A0A8T0RMU2_PANVG|nr:GDSL esterase/lipase At1g33811-like [Panicum virgatum]KAG2587622.1 hypothetical protein PVAP13_5NG161481 [Panicum virgatum]
MHAVAVSRSIEVARGGRRSPETMGYDGRRLALALAVAACWAAESIAWGAPRPAAPCMYVFGDSLVDNGNNNGILSLARANYRPYGIDFREGPPGRFTNGRTMVDFLSDMLGLRPPLVPPYATARPADLPRGANFASGASGILAETGNNLGGHYPLSEQVEHFRAAVGAMGNASAFRGNATRLAEHLGRCIFFVGMGSNDYLNNYFMPGYYDTAQRYGPRDYAALLLQGYAAQLAALYGLGARKFVVAGVGQIGCIPYELARMNSDNQPSVGSEDISISIGIGGGGGGVWSSPTSSNTSGSGGGGVSGNAKPTPPDGAGACNETINSAIAIYNRGLLAMVKRFNGRGGQLRGARLVFLDTVQSGTDLAANAAAHGFTVLDRGCCGVGRNNGQITCLPLQRPCDDRSAYLFWDAFHPTEAVNRIYAAKAFGSNNTAEVYPINVSQLAAL